MAARIETGIRAQAPRFIALEWNAPELYGVLGGLVESGWQLAYCVGYGMRDRIKGDFPSAIYQDTHDARYGLHANDLVDLKPSAVDQPTAEALSFVELMCLKQMDRMELMGSFSLHDRLIHFHKLVGYWSAVLETLQPDVLLMPTSPHVTYDYVAYVLAQRRGIPIILFEYVTLAGMLVAMNGFENGVPQIMDRYQSLRESNSSEPIVLSERMEGHWQALKGSYEGAKPPGLRQVLSGAEAYTRMLDAQEQHDAQERRKLAEYQERKSQSFFRRLRGELAASDPGSRLSPSSIVRAARAARAPLVPPTLNLTPPPPADGYYKGKFRLQWPEDVSLLAAEFRKKHVERMREYYDRISVRADHAEPYIYVPLHLQPERATNPNGRVFDEQNVMIALISSVMPDGWRIYVKEHPAHFLPNYATDRGRHISFYETLTTIPGVALVSRDTSSFDLIDKARAVATVTGTASWEALVRGVPTLVFGEAWYKGCEGAYSVRTVDDCRRALLRIAEGERPSDRGVRLFLRAAEEVAFVGFLSADDQTIAGIDYATNTERLTGAVRRCYDECYSSRTADKVA